MGTGDTPHLVLTCNAGTRTQLVKYGLLVSNRVTKASSWCLLLSTLSGPSDRRERRGWRDRWDIVKQWIRRKRNRLYLGVHFLKIIKQRLHSVFEQTLWKSYPFLWCHSQGLATPLGHWQTRWSGGSPLPACSSCETPTQRKITKRIFNLTPFFFNQYLNNWFTDTMFCSLEYQYELRWVQQQAWPVQTPCGWSCVHQATPAEGRGLGKSAAWAKPAGGRTSPDWRSPPPAALICCDAAWTSPPVADQTAPQRDHSRQINYIFTSLFLVNHMCTIL